MSKNIDFLNGNNKKDNNNIDIIMKKKTGNGSKTSKKDIKSETHKKSLRGRRPKKIITSDDILPEDIVDIPEKPETTKKKKSNEKTQPAVIARLKLDPSKLPAEMLKKNKSEKKITKFEFKNEEDNDDLPTYRKIQKKSITSFHEGMFDDDIPLDHMCPRCTKNEDTINILKLKLEKYEKKEKILKTKHVFNTDLNLISMDNGKKIKIKRTDIKCWWDSNSFQSLPCFLPELYHNETYYVTGCFCSFNCALAYNLYFLKDSKIYARKALVYKLYREIYGMTSYDIEDSKSLEIAIAAPRQTLIDFGGELTIEEYRKKFNNINREYVIYIPPIKPMNIIIEEINNNDDDDGEELLLKSNLKKGNKLNTFSKK